MIIIWKQRKENCSSTSMVTVSVILLLELHINRCLYCKQSYLLSAAKSHRALPSCHDVLLNPFDIDGRSVGCDCTAITLLPWKCTVLIWKGQLFILISSSLKWCFNVIYISHWLFKLLNVFYYYLMGQNAELNIYIENLISEPFWHVTQFFSCCR